MIDVFVVIKIPDYKKSAYAIKKRKNLLWFFRLGKILELLDPKEKHYSGPSSRIKGFKTWKFLTEEKWKKVFGHEVELCGTRKQCCLCQT